MEERHRYQQLVREPNTTEDRTRRRVRSSAPSGAAPWVRYRLSEHGRDGRVLDRAPAPSVTLPTAGSSTQAPAVCPVAGQVVSVMPPAASVGPVDPSQIAAQVKVTVLDQATTVVAGGQGLAFQVQRSDAGEAPQV